MRASVMTCVGLLSTACVRGDPASDATVAAAGRLDGLAVGRWEDAYPAFGRDSTLRAARVENRFLTDGQGRWLVREVCEGPQCSWGTWSLGDTLTIRRAPIASADSLGVIAAGAEMCVETGVLLLDPAGQAIALRRRAELSEHDDSSIVEVGDTITILTADGAPDYHARWRDRIIYPRLAVGPEGGVTADSNYRVLRWPRRVQWFRVYDPESGRRGWVMRGDAKRTNEGDVPCRPSAAEITSGLAAAANDSPVATAASTYPMFRTDSAMLLASEFGAGPKTDSAGRWFVDGYCPGERCEYYAMRFNDPVVLRRAPQRTADSVMTILPQRIACERTAMLLIHEPELYVARKPLKLGDTLPIAVGDTVALLNYLGETHYWVFAKGRLLVSWELDSRLRGAGDTTHTGAYRIARAPRDESWTLIEDPYTKRKGWMLSRSVSGTELEGPTLCAPARPEP